MAATIKISMIGDKALIKRFNDLDAKSQGKVFRPAVRKSVNPVLTTARALAPKRSGAMARGLTIRAFRSAKKLRKGVGAMVVTPTREKLGIAEKAAWYYPSLVELGHKKKGGRGRVAGRPFLRNALKSNKSRVFQILRSEIWSGLLKIARNR